MLLFPHSANVVGDIRSGETSVDSPSSLNGKNKHTLCVKNTITHIWYQHTKVYAKFGLKRIVKTNDDDDDDTNTNIHRQQRRARTYTLYTRVEQKTKCSDAECIYTIEHGNVQKRPDVMKKKEI